MPLEPGARLGAYEIRHALGAGGMGEVYRARDTRLDRDVAVKILPESFASDPDRLMRFEREAKALAALNHPNIAAIYGIEGTSGALALVMELVEGRDLSEIIAGGLSLDEALSIARQIAAALDAAHEARIIHRDLKPANIKVRDDGTVKVLDFGLAKAVAGDGVGQQDPSRVSLTATSPAMTAVGAILGTAAYMSPEQARGRPVDERADIWAFGAILYEMLTGRRLFDGESVSDTIAAVLRETPDLNLAPPQARRALAACLERDPKQRLRDIGDVWLLFDDAPVAATAASRRVLAPWVVTGFVVGALLASGVMSFFSGPAMPESITLLEPPPPGTQFVGAPVPSPDGRHLAMLVRDAAGTTSIWMRAIQAETAQPLAGTEGATLLFWSPDGAELAFYVDSQLRRVARGGGPSSLIAAIRELTGGVWPSGRDIFISTRNRGLAKVPASGGAVRPVPDTDAAFLRDLDVTPDGRHVIFTQFGGETGVHVTAPDRGGHALLIPGEETRARVVGDVIVREHAGALLGQRFNPADLSLVGEPFPIAQDVGPNAFAGSAAGALAYVHGADVIERLTWFSRTGERIGTTGPEGQFREVLLSRGGRWLVFVQQDPSLGTADIWVQSVSGGAPNRLTSDPGIDHLVAISHDDREIAWEAHAGGVLNLMRRPADGSAAARLERPWSKAGGPTDWSPDGRFVLYESDDGSSRYNLWMVPMDRSGPPVVLVESEFDDREGALSPDGRWLAYVSDASGRNEVYLQRLDGLTLTGGLQRLSENGGAQPLWRQDGKELFFLSDGTVMSADVGPGSPGASAPRALFTIPAFRSEERNYAVSPDGQRFVAIVPIVDSTARPATVMLNWQSARRR